MTAETIELKCSRAAMSRKRIKKNILVMCIGAFTLFTAYDGPTMLQSTMNREVGVAALAINYACFCISALLFPKYFIKRYGSKATFVLSMILYIPYIASNYYPHWVVMIPVSVLIGFSAALLWSSQATYLNDASVMLAGLSISKKENDEHYSNRLKNDTIHPSQLRRNPCNQTGKNATATEIEAGSKTSLDEKSKSRNKNTLYAFPGPKTSRADIKDVNNFLEDIGSSTINFTHHDLEVGDNNLLQTELGINDKNRFPEPLKTNNWSTNEQEDKNSHQGQKRAELRSGNRLFEIEASGMTAPPSETDANKLDVEIKHPLAKEKNASLQVTNEILPPLDNVRNLSLSERQKSAENYRRFSNDFACDKEGGVRTTSGNSVRNISGETIENRKVNMSGFDHADGIIELRTSKSDEPYSKTKVESITARVFGIHGMAFLLSHLSGNLLAYFILKEGVVDAQHVLVNSTCACGANYCNNANCLTNNLEGVSDEIRITLTTVCVSLAVVSVLIVALLLEPLETKSAKASISLEFLMATYEITKRTNLVLLIPYTLYLGQIQGFFTGEFNKVNF